jgi:diadenosine tetraphosphate (Ap4A) HIT family hydrolase
MINDCVFCEIIAGNSPATIVRQWDDAVAIEPRNPVTPGHVLVIPHQHVTDVSTNLRVTALTAAHAGELAAELPDANVVTSRGEAATQTVFHLHFHVVPRYLGDGLTLPWTPKMASTRQPNGGINVVCAREPIPNGPSVFLAGPTPRTADVASWRNTAILRLERLWDGPGTLNVLTPESRDGHRAVEYDDQVEWETAGLDSATQILFWIPRDLETLPGFTTNVEFGLYARSGRVVLGAPPSCPNPERNRYLIFTAHRYGMPVFETLDETITAALDRVAESFKPW